VDDAVGPVDVLPAQGAQFARAQAGLGGEADGRTRERREVPTVLVEDVRMGVGDHRRASTVELADGPTAHRPPAGLGGTRDRFNLLGGEDVEVARRPGRRDRLGLERRVVRDPALLVRALEDAAERAEDLRDEAARETVHGQQSQGVGVDVRCRDRRQGALGAELG
jgi:hypothetical protein